MNEPVMGSGSIAAQKDTSIDATDGALHKFITSFGFKYPDVGPAKVTVYYYEDDGEDGNGYDAELQKSHRDYYNLHKEGGPKLYITNMGVPGHCMYFQAHFSFTRLWEQLMNGPDQVPAKYRFWVTGPSLQVSGTDTHTLMAART